MVEIIRKLSPPNCLWALHNWIYGPPTEKIVLSLVICLCRIDDGEAEFLLKNISTYNRAVLSEKIALEIERYVKATIHKREFKPKTILTTEDNRSFDMDVLLDCGCTGFPNL
jgi:hypothetical protein